MTSHNPNHPVETLTQSERIGILLEEYRVLYSLVSFRMGSLDRRVPIAWAGVATFLVSFSAADLPSRLALLVTLPPATLWFFGTTATHTKSFEDVIRRIDEIERLVNRLAGETLLAFQSQHPSQGVRVGGRTGTGTARAVCATCLSLLGIACYLVASTAALSCFLPYYAAYAGAAALELGRGLYMLGRYRYRRSAAWGNGFP